MMNVIRGHWPSVVLLVFNAILLVLMVSVSRPVNAAPPDDLHRIAVALESIARSQERIAERCK